MTACFENVLLGLPVYSSAATIIGLVVLVVWIWQQEDFLGRRYFVATVVGMVLWVSMATVELMVPTLSCKTAVALATWPAIALVPIAWCLFIWHFCFGVSIQRTGGEVMVGAAIILAVSAAAFTNPLHGHFYGPDTVLVTDDGRPHVNFHHQALFYVVAALLYIFMIISLLIATIAAFRASRTLRPLMFLLMIATAVPIISNLAYLIFDAQVAGFDPTPFAFSFVLLTLTWAIYATRGLDLVSVARDLLYFNTLDPVLVVNAKGLVVGTNAAALKVMPEFRQGYHLRPDGPLAAVWDVLQGDGHQTQEAHLSIAERRFNLRALPIPRPLAENGHHLGAVAIMSDITALERQNAQLKAALDQSRMQVEEISRLRDIAESSAMSDALTKIGNRRALELRAETLVDETFIIALIDLDHFKAINDQLGHAVGDRVLKDFASIARSTLPPNAEIFRVGGEEFVVLAIGMSMSEFGLLLNRFKKQLADTFAMRERDGVFLTFSAGVAAFPSDGSTLEQLYACADTRLYSAKLSGRDRIVGDNTLLSETGWTAETASLSRGYEVK